MTIPPSMEHMTLDELLRRKAVDYGFRSLRGMAKALGIGRTRMYNITTGKVKLSIEMRRLIVRELDVAPEILDRMI